MENNIQDKLRIVWMAGHVIWVHKFTKHIHEIDEWSVERLHKKICHSIFGWHTNLQQNKRRTLKTFNNSDGKIAARAVADKYERKVGNASIN